MKIDKKILAQARATDVLAFFEQQNGFTFNYSNGIYRCKQHKSLAIKSDRLSWFWHSKGIGGFGALDYLIKIENIPFRQAVEIVTGATLKTLETAQPQQEIEKNKILVLPQKSNISMNLYSYLCLKRGIDNSIVNMLIQKEMLFEDNRSNVVFVSFDECHKPKFASLRGTQNNSGFRGDCSGSDKRYGFTMTEENVIFEKVYIFESPIDAMSHATLENLFTGDADAWKKDSRLSLSGITDTAIPFFLNQHKSIRELVFCLDNDTAGREAAAIMARKYAYKGYTALNELPRGKDFNEDLQAHTAQIRAEKRTKSSHRDVDI